jgi:hypothetical protein
MLSEFIELRTTVFVQVDERRGFGDEDDQAVVDT